MNEDILLPDSSTELTTAKGKVKKPRRPGPKGLGLKQLLAKKYKMLEGVPPEITAAFGELTEQILMVVYGPSGNGKSRLVMQFIRILMDHGDVMYVSPEEGHRKTMQKTAKDTLDEEKHSGKITFWDHDMTFEELVIKLKKKKSPKYVVIDSLQYWQISFAQYKQLKEMFPNKGFIFISHSEGKAPKGGVAKAILYDVDIKVRVEGGVAFVMARGNGDRKYIISEAKALDYWGTKELNKFKKSIKQAA